MNPKKIFFFLFQGGYVDTVLEYYYNQGAAVLENDYQYEGREGNCRADTKSKIFIEDFDFYEDTLSMDEIMRLIDSHGPIILFIKSESLPHYTDGIINDEYCYHQDKVNHAIVAAGK